MPDGHSRPSLLGWPHGSVAKEGVHDAPEHDAGFVLVVLLGTARAGARPTIGQDAASDAAVHPFVGTWIMDTISAGENDSPEIAVVTADGGVVGQGANRSAGGRWEAVGDHAVELTLVSGVRAASCRIRSAILSCLCRAEAPFRGAFLMSSMIPSGW